MGSNGNGHGGRDGGVLLLEVSPRTPATVTLPLGAAVPVAPDDPGRVEMPAWTSDREGQTWDERTRARMTCVLAHPHGGPCKWPSVVVPVAPPRPELRLDLACGQRCEPGWTGVDLHATGAQKVDLTVFPWPWADGSVIEARSMHFVEHLPAVEVDHGGRRKDLFLAFFDELWRVAAPGCRVTIVVPHCQSRRAFWDPTHRRYLAPETFLYLSAGWRKLQGLDHYPVDCDWTIANAAPSHDAAENLRAPEVVGKRLNECWNVAVDIHATLLKPEQTRRDS